MASDKARCWAVVPAAGVGARMGGSTPKQYQVIAGATVLEHSLRAILASPAIQAVCVALQVNDEWARGIELLADSRVTSVAGAQQRSGSVLAGINGLRDADPQDWVLVHDAARPCLRPQEVEALVTAVVDAGCGGLLAEQVVDTVKRADEHGRVIETLPRQGLWRAQTPQMFRLGELRAAITAAHEQGVAVTDEAAAMELAGYPVQVVPGSSQNIKVTVAADLELAAGFLTRSKACE